MALIAFSPNGEKNALLSVSGILLFHFDYETAPQAFEQALAADSESAGAYYGKAFALFKMRKLDMAKECLTQAQHLNKDLQEVHLFKDQKLENRCLLLWGEVFDFKKKMVSLKRQLIAQQCLNMRKGVDIKEILPSFICFYCINCNIAKYGIC